MNKLPASTGWLWVRQGFALFRKQPGVLTMLLVANILASLLISSVPLVGPMLAMILIPSFSMAVMQACTVIEQGQRASPGVLLTGFRKPAVISLCKLGLVYLAVSVVLTIITHLTVNDDFWLQVTRPIDPKTGPQVNPSDLLAMLMVFALQVVALMALCFAAPLTYWQKMPPMKATFYSFFAVLGVARVFLVMLLVWFGIFLGVSMVLTLIFNNANAGRVIIMWVVLMFVLLLQCAIYVGYRQIFGYPDAAPNPGPGAAAAP